VEASIKYVREEARGKKASKASISIQVAPTNFAAQGLYERAGFYVSEKAIVMNSEHGEESVMGLEMEVNLGSEV
jgi:ribosomal protein S18 acetylase RimI-like enzyme